MKAHIKEHPAWFHRFDALWTPTVLIFDSNGVEQFRIEGYLPNSEFRAQLEMGLARIAFMNKQWADAEQRYAEVARGYSECMSAAEAIYWKGVAHYKSTSDPTSLGEAAKRLQERFRDTLWAKKASVWLPQAAGG